MKKSQCAKTLSKLLSKLGQNEKTWSHIGDQKKAKFIKVINQLIIYKFFKEFINHKKKTNRAVVFSCRCLPNILKYCDYRLNIKKFRWSRFNQAQIKNFTANMYESSGSQFLQTTTGTQRKPETLWVIKVSYDPTLPTWELKEYYAVSA